nr:hypothetical protein [Tanacetum cinerariifolium]
MVVVNHVMDIIVNYELAEYDQSISTDHPIFLSSDEGHSVQDKEYLENPFNEITDNESDLEPEAPTDTELLSTEDIHPLAVQESPHDLDIHQLIEECSIEFPEEQKQKMENTIALDSKLLSINSINSQHLEKKEQEVKNVVEQPAERRNHAEKSLQNFRVVHKSSISFKKTSQISSIHSIAPIESTEEHEHLLSMGYEHLSITPKTESDEVTEFNAENLLPIPSKCEVTLKDKIECDMPAKDVCSSVFNTFSNPLFKDDDDLDSSDDETLSDEDVPAEEFKIYSNPLCDEDEINSDKLDPHCFNDGNSQQEEIDIVTETDDVLPPSDENDDDLSNDSLLGEADLFLSDNSIPTGIENVDPEGDVRFLEELLINDSILSHESYDFNFEDNPLIPRPPPKPSDVESFFDLKPDDYPPEIEIILCWIYV